MSGMLKESSGSLFDFGPFANEYENWYSTAEGQAHDLVQRLDVSALLPSVQDRRRLLDVGCGTGHWSGFFSSLGYDVHGIDVSEEMIQVARKTVQGCTFDVADAGNVPFPSESFDVVASMAALEFMPDPAGVISEMARCTRPGGSMLIGTLNRIAPINMERLDKGEEPYASAHLSSPEEIREMLSAWGRIRMAASPVVEWRQNPRIIDADRLADLEEPLDGPLLVAEVKRP
jgi:ubiquinone/menaquinone biosynthesis C-methylase UbiE